MIDGRQDLSSKLSRKKNLFFCLLSPSFALHLQLVEIRCGLFPRLQSHYMGCDFGVPLAVPGNSAASSVLCCVPRLIYPQCKALTADDEPVDPKKYLEESCKPKCVKPLLEYQACVKRIQGDDSGHKHCTGQYFDYWSCVDKCVALKLFPKLK
ncbi:hypothetical protein CsatB_015211 [Cannabis sativa]